jgi:hypothetical protein
MAKARNRRSWGAADAFGGGDCQFDLCGSPRISSAILQAGDASFTVARHYALTVDERPKAGGREDYAADEFLLFNAAGVNAG